MIYSAPSVPDPATPILRQLAPLMLLNQRVLGPSQIVIARNYVYKVSILTQIVANAQCTSRNSSRKSQNCANSVISKEEGERKSLVMRLVST